ncbi:MAG: hypothetical protein V7603_5010, partial [Micromonosporaceae bacterium]
VHLVLVVFGAVVTARKPRGDHAEGMRRFSLGVVAVAAVVTLGLAGCGKGTAPVAQEDKEKMVKYAECMRQYGINIPIPEDGEPAGGMVTFKPDDPKMQAAQAACARLAPNPHRQGKLSAAQEDHALKLAECLRKHDIKAKDPAPGTAEVTLEEGATYTQEKLVAAYTVCNKEVPAPSDG